MCGFGSHYTLTSAHSTAPVSQYLHGLDEAGFQDEGWEERRKKNRDADPKEEDELALNIEPSDRFNADLLMITEIMLDDFTHGVGMRQDDIVSILKSRLPTDAYEATLATPVEKLPRAAQYPLSGLFTFCWPVST